MTQYTCHSARSEAKSRNPRRRSKEALHGFRDCARNDGREVVSFLLTEPY
jgi:hypothetical protein